MYTRLIESISVALLVSAWIEILISFKVTIIRHVALLVSAWIEMILFVNHLHPFERVALLVSAWIEIALLNSAASSYHVALLVSAWIEIASSDPNM